MNPSAEPSVDVRSGTADDLVGTHACLDSVARERRYLAAFEAPPIQSCSQFWTTLMERNDPFEVAAIGAKIVGWCDISRHSHPALSHSGVLGMGVAASYRGRGIGRRLLSAALAHARLRDFERIELNVVASNTPAIKLYQTAGFEVEGIRQRYRKMDGVYEDGIAMALLFSRLSS